MKENQLKEALDSLEPSDQLKEQVWQALQTEQKKRSIPHRKGYWKLAAAAACLVLCLAGIWQLRGDTSLIAQQDTAAGGVQSSQNENIHPESEEAQPSLQQNNEMEKAAKDSAVMQEKQQADMDRGSLAASAMTIPLHTVVQGKVVSLEKQSQGSWIQMEVSSVYGEAIEEKDTFQFWTENLEGSSSQLLFSEGEELLVPLQKQGDDWVWNGMSPIICRQEGDYQFFADDWPELVSHSQTPDSNGMVISDETDLPEQMLGILNEQESK